MEHGIFFWFLAILAAIFVGLGKGGLPVIASLAVPSLSLVMSPITAAGLLLPVYIVSDIFALSAYRRDNDKQVVIIAIVGMTAGVFIGWLTAHIMIEWAVTFLIGLMGSVFALHSILDKSPQVDRGQILNKKRGYFWCTIAGFTSFISHNGGPPWQIFIVPLRLSKTVFVGTSVIAFSYCNAIKLVPYYLLGQVNLFSFKVSLYLMIPASIAVYAGVKLVKLIPEKVFFKLVIWCLLAISLRLMWNGVSGFLQP